MIIAVVGAGPCGLFSSLRLLETYPSAVVHLFEATDHIGGRTVMSRYHGVPVVTGAGVVRHRDRLLRKLAQRFGIPLRRFTTDIRYAFPKTEPILRVLRRLHPVDRRKTFRQHFIHTLGDKAYHDFCQMAGATDFQDADVVDTIYDYGFQDNTPGQIMYGIDWDGLMDAILLECMGHPNFHLHLDTPIHKVIHKDIHKDIHKPIHKYMINDTWHVDVIFWTAPRPSWGVIPVRTARWKAVMDGVGCQSFLRGYSVPFARDLEKARKMFPTTTFFPAENPLQKLIPYRKDVYMIAYDDNAAADTVAENGCNRKWLYGLTGIRWRRPRLFYHECGTQFFRPLDQQIWTDRDAFLSDAQNPREGLYVCGEGLSGNQGWTEGALESAEHVLALFLHAEKPSRIMTTTGTDRI